MKHIFAIVWFGVALAFLGGGCNSVTNTNLIHEDDRPNYSTTPNELFKGVLFDPVPVSVRHLEGYGELSQGHTIYLKFEASQNFIFNELLKLHDYKKADCKDANMKDLIPQGDYSKSLGFWDVEQVKLLPTVKCYTASGYKNHWTSEGTSQIMVNDVLNEPTTAETYWTVYFHEVGI
jgi:hypothetical protein